MVIGLSVKYSTQFKNRRKLKFVCGKFIPRIAEGLTYTLAL